MAAKLGNGKTWEANVVFCFLLFFVPMMTIGTTTGSGEKESPSQKNLNKPAVKSIKSPDGDIIDCVHILNQPAFDHPKLKNHKIQMRPNFHPERRILEGSKVSSKSTPIAQLWHQSGSCPEGTIPIRRPRKDDILRPSSIQQFRKKNHKSIPLPRYVEPLPSLINRGALQHAIVYEEGDNYFGAKATMNVWNPNVQQPDELSSSQIWIHSDDFVQDFDRIEAGWQVSQDLYGDNNTRLFTFWTGNSYKGPECYNLHCPGFIQINSQVALGASISPLSTYGGSQYEITILIWKDGLRGDWWMQYGNNLVMGYWPSSLFNYLSNSANRIQWGGEVVNSQSDGQHTTTQMGSGHFPEEGFGKASYFRDLQIVKYADNHLVPPKNVSTYTDQSNCYNVQNLQHGNSSEWSNYFYYGGPGRNHNCA